MKRRVIRDDVGRYVLQEWNPHYRCWVTVNIYHDEREGYFMAQLYKLNHPFWDYSETR